MQRIVIIGAGGRLGKALVREYAKEYEVIPLKHNDIDLASVISMDKCLNPLEFDLLINCGALTDVDYCEKNIQEALNINCYAPKYLANFALMKNARMIHISTDYVFRGDNKIPYAENDETCPISNYGMTKNQGDVWVSSRSVDNLIIRTSWVFGPDSDSFIDNIISKSKVSEEVFAVSDKFSTPAYTLDIAKYLKPFLFDNPIGGILNICNSGECSWQEFGQHAINCILDNGIELKGTIVKPQKMSEISAFIAKRPVYTVLSTNKLTEYLGYEPRSWQDAVKEYVKEYKL